MGRSDESTNILYGGYKLRTDESLNEGDYTFVMQSDCNLVLYANNNNQVMWSSETNNLGRRCFARMQTDGNLVIFDGINFNKIWDSNTRGPEGKYILVLQRDGHVVIYGSPIWTIPNDEPTNRKIAMLTKH
ncbi:mannose-specific lectin-like [Zingiber officinale]|nr:mannose-specific lectin-like [Zingiber officinale]